MKTVTKTYTGAKDSGIKEEYTATEYESLEEAISNLTDEKVLTLVNRGVAREAQIACRARVTPAKEPKTQKGKLARFLTLNPDMLEEVKNLARAKGLSV